MARKDKFEFDIPSKKEKKEKPQRENSEGKKLFGEGSFFSELFSKKSFSLDDNFSMDSDSENKSKGLKWWHILLIVLGAIIIVVGIIVGIIAGQINENVPGGVGGIVGGTGGGEGSEDGVVDDTPEIEGVVSTVGTFLPEDAQEYILCEYTDLFSGQTTIILQKSSGMQYNYSAYYQLISPKGVVQERYSGEYTGEKTPEELKAEIYADVKSNYKVDDAYMETCTFVIYQPVSFTRVTISEVTLTDTEITVKYSAGAVDGEMSEEYTLTGTYTKIDNDYTFTYAELPEDENLLRVAENLLGSAKYEYYAMYGSWVNELTFGDSYKLTLLSPTEEE